MEENQPKTGKFALNFGLILGAISVVFGVMLFSLDMHYSQDWTIGIINLAITIAVLAVGIVQFKKANNGFITLPEALKVGVGAAAIAAVIALIYGAILANVIDPDFVDKAMEARFSEPVANGTMTSEEAQQAMEAGKSFFWIGYPIQLIVAVFLGFIISLIVGLVVKKQKPEY
ncbi:DUF4199 domain-containing protein [Spongiimicrobium salis]|uniref:DUF4199 domain-containing protein n=1 Tax=Spongiimicrobium salis TaxID=1667022 RepID=UPI00374CEB67